MRFIAFAVAAGLATSAAMAQDMTVENGVLTYEVFENTVDHADLADCPADLAGEDRFCRANLHRETLNIFVFSHEGDQPLIGVTRIPVEEITLPQ